MHHHHDHALVVLSVVIAIFASYTALDLVNSLSTSRGRIKWIWLIGGALAMGVGIWSMHFIGMLAFRFPHMNIYYDVPLMLLSIAVAILASALALYIVSSLTLTVMTYMIGSLIMGAAIAGMHYIGIASMRMNAVIHWDYFYVVLSILIAIGASFGAIYLAFKLSTDLSLKGFIYRGLAGVLMGIAISGMHYTAMAAMSFTLDNSIAITNQELLATDGLAAAIIVGTLVILGIALSGSNIDRALSKKSVLNDVLQEGIRMRDQFLSLASHELKTPLTALKLQTEIIVRKLAKGEIEHDELIRLLAKNDLHLNRINRLVDDMLDISRITSGQFILNKVEVNLGEILEDVVERYKLQLDGKIQIHADNVMGHFDVLRIEQVLTNLVSNALKYGEGSIVYVELQERGDKALLSVKDEGMGIPPEAQDKIFGRFERAVKTTDIRGLGLGLFIVREIAEAHGGHVWVESEVGKGAKFFVELPKA